MIEHDTAEHKLVEDFAHRILIFAFKVIYGVA